LSSAVMLLYHPRLLPYSLVRIKLGEILDSGKNLIRARIEPRTITLKGESLTDCAMVTFLYCGGEGDPTNIPAADSPLPPGAP
jgi:hypothetical protein